MLLQDPFEIICHPRNHHANFQRANESLVQNYYYAVVFFPSLCCRVILLWEFCWHRGPPPYGGTALAREGGTPPPPLEWHKDLLTHNKQCLFMH